MAFFKEDRATTETPTVPLAALETGSAARIQRTELPAEEARVLEAMGLALGSDVRVCKRGEPWIVQSGGTRIGLTAQVAKSLHVTVPTATAS